MRVDEFDFDLPEERIALRPMEPRESARLLRVLGDGSVSDHSVGDLPDLLRPDDLVVFNDTRVIPARLRGERRRGKAVAKVEALLHLREAPDTWRAFLRPAKRVKAGERLEFGSLAGEVLGDPEHGEASIRFAVGGEALDEALAGNGTLPLPPYIETKRAVDERDARDYQTLFADEPGAVAAPTAGLHWTPRMLRGLAEHGIDTLTVTLHVGAGTFLPVKTDTVEEHRMHAEWGRISEHAAERLNDARARGGRIVSVGTTTLRLLESAVRDDGSFEPWQGTTDIFIVPGKKLRTASVLMTNFHLPKSTLMMLVSAFSGTETIRRAYAHAVDEGYRFYSYGDACLLERNA